MGHVMEGMAKKKWSGICLEVDDYNEGDKFEKLEKLKQQMLQKLNKSLLRSQALDNQTEAMEANFSYFGQ